MAEAEALQLAECFGACDLFAAGAPPYVADGDALVIIVALLAWLFGCLAVGVGIRLAADAPWTFPSAVRGEWVLRSLARTSDSRRERDGRYSPW